jgi:hypothetical protein
MEWDYYLHQFLMVLISSLPWLVGGVGALCILSFGPIGRALGRRIRHGTEGSEQSAVILEELAAIRQQLEEVIERQYVTDRLLTGKRGERITPVLPTPGVGEERDHAPR